MKITKIVLGCLLSSFLVPLKSLEHFGSKRAEATIDIALGNEKKAEIAALQNDVVSTEEKEKKFWQDNQQKYDRFKTDIEQLEFDIKKPHRDIELSNRRLIILKSIKQMFASFRALWKEIVSIDKQHIALLESYAKDSDFSSLQLEKKSTYTFDDLQELNQQIAAQEEKTEALQTELKESYADLANHKKKLVNVENAHKEKLQDQADLIAKKTTVIIPDGLNPRQYGQIVDLQVVLGEYEKELTLLRIKKEEVDVAYIISKLDVARKRMTVLRLKRDSMTRMSLRVDENDVVLRREALAYLKKEYLNSLEQLVQQAETCTTQQEMVKEELQRFIDEHQGTFQDRSMFTEWSTRPTTTDGFNALAQAGLIQERINYSKREEDLFRAQIDLKKAEFSQEELTFDTVQTWFKIKHKRFRTSEEFSKELKRYSGIVSSFDRDKDVFEEKRRVAAARLNVQNKSLASIKELREKSGGYQRQYDSVFQQAAQLVSKQVEITSKLIEVYSQHLIILNRLVWQSNTMIEELERASLWHRSSGAISREGINNLLPDLKGFVADLNTLWFAYVAEVSSGSWWEGISDSFSDIWFVLFFILKIALASIAFFFFQKRIMRASVLLQKVTKEVLWVYRLCLFCAMCLEFVHSTFIGIFFWSIGFIFLGWYPFPTIPSILFFLITIPYFLYLSRNFVVYWAQFNTRSNYVFFSESFAERFVPFIQWLLYTTVIIFPFREAFILTTYNKSELPDILFALYSIILRVLLLALIQKDDLLSLIPTKTTFGNWLWRLVNSYYYVLLGGFIVLMIMMDPHIGGYNKLVFYLIWGTIGTFFTIKGAIELYALCSRSASFVFFSSDGEVLKDRFQLSRTLYGVSIILLFILFVFFGLLVVAWVWGRPLSWGMIKEFLSAQRMTVSREISGVTEYRKLSILDVTEVFAFIPFGIFVGWVIDRFLVHRIFSVLLVKPGVQNAVSTIIYYIVVISVITVGLWSEGFGFVVAYFMAPILLGLAWSLRDVFNDFVAYFVILIQRPLKVGDYVKLDEETSGVVRTISPRAVVLRKKRGFSVIVPNSRIISQTITNWDYNLNFISCPDIIVHVPYKFGADNSRAVIMGAIEKCAQVLKVPAPLVRLDDFAPQGYMFMVRVYTSPENTLLQWDIASDVRLSIDRSIRERGMEIAIPMSIIKLEQGQKKGEVEPLPLHHIE